MRVVRRKGELAIARVCRLEVNHVVGTQGWFSGYAWKIFVGEKKLFKKLFKSATSIDDEADTADA
jgi:hypothetical protein